MMWINDRIRELNWTFKNNRNSPFDYVLLAFGAIVVVLFSPIIIPLMIAGYGVRLIINALDVVLNKE